MDKTLSLIPKKNGKKKWILNYVLFVIVKAATIESIDKVLNNLKERYKFKDVSLSQLVERLGDKNSQVIVNNNGFYHRQCYQDITNKEKLKRDEKRCNKAISQATPSASKPKKRGPSMTNLTEERVTRSQSVPYEKRQCIICQKIGGQPHKVEKKETSQKTLEVSQKLPDKGMYRRLNSTVIPGDTIANNALYQSLLGYCKKES